MIPPNLRQHLHREIVSFLVNNPLFQQFARSTHSRISGSASRLRQASSQGDDLASDTDRLSSTFLRELVDSARKILPFINKSK